MQESTQAWEHLLHTSGGKLQLDKCAFYIIEWKFNKDGTHYINKTSTEALIIKSSSTGVKYHIKLLDNYTPFTHLGVTSTPMDHQNMNYNRWS